MAVFLTLNKKGIFLPAIALFSIFLFAFMFWTFTEKKANFTKVVGEEQVALIQSYLDAEKDLYVLDQIASYAVQRAFTDLAEHSGQLPSSSCIADTGFFVLYSHPDCTFDDRGLYAAFEQYFMKHFAFYLSTQPFNLTLDDYRFAFDYRSDSLHVTGDTSKPLVYRTPSSNYSIEFDFDLTLPVDFSVYKEILEVLAASRHCLQSTPYNEFTDDTTFLSRSCNLNTTFTWSLVKRVDLLLVTATVPTELSHASNVDIHFAINLNSLNELRIAEPDSFVVQTIIS